MKSRQKKEKTHMDPMSMDTGSAAAAGGLALLPMLISLVVAIFIIAATWKVFKKGGQPGWGCIIPIYNIICLLKIAGKPAWWVILWFVPLLNIVIVIMSYAGVAKSFGKGVGFVIGMTLLPFIFWPILGFGSAQYQGAVEAAPAA